MDTQMPYGANPFNVATFLNSLKEYSDWANTSDPRLTPAGQLSRDLTVGAPGILMQKLGQPLQGAIEAAQPTAQALGQGLSTFATVPQGQLQAEAAAQQAQMAAAPQLPSGAEMAAQWLQQGPATKSVDIPLGASTELPLPPEMPTPTPVDYSAMQQWMDKAAPQAPETSADPQKEMILSAILGALQGEDVSGILAGAAGGAIQGKMSSEERAKQEREKYAQQQREYAAARAQTEQSMAESKGRFDSQAAEIAYRNNLAKYQVQLKNLEAAQPQVLGVKDGVVQLLLTENGQRVVRMVDPLSGGRHAAISALANKAGATRDEAGQLAASAVGVGPVDVLSAVANDIKDNGTWAQILPPEVRANLVERVSEQLMASGVEGAERGKMFDRLLTGELMAMLTTSPELMARAASGSTLAASLIRSSIDGNAGR